MNGGDDFLERCKFFREHVQTVLNLATGSLVLSVTFLQDRTGLVRPEFLRRAWYWLAASVLLGLAYNYVLSIFLRKRGSRFDGTLAGLSLAFHLAFIVGLVHLVRFGLANLK